MDETLFTIIKYAIGISALIIFRYVIPFAKLKLENSKYVSVLTFIETCINAAESVYKNAPKSGDEKKQYVIENVTKYIVEKGIKITDAQVDILIQGIFTELEGITVNK